MDIKRWRVMLAVDDYGSFTRAGEILGYTQSGITQMMKSLEKEVGFSLFIKDKHGMRLTAEAKSLVPAVRRLLNADEVVRQEIASLKGAQVGVIKIGTYLSCSIHWIPRDHPGIPAQLIPTSIVQNYRRILEGELADWIQERRVDIGFSQPAARTSLPVPSLLWTTSCWRSCPPDIPCAAYDPAIPLEKLNGAPFVMPRSMPPEAMCTAILTQHQHQSPTSVSSLSTNSLCFPWSNTDLGSHHPARTPCSADRPGPFCSSAAYHARPLPASSDWPTLLPTATFRRPPGAFLEYAKRFPAG